MPAIRENRTRWVVLGMLALAPATGYALRQRIESSVGFFWQESFGQLYPVLAALAKEGLIKPSRGSRGARAHVEYAITAAGRTALRGWLAIPPAPSVERNELLLKLFLGPEGDPATAIAMIERSRAEAEGQEQTLAGLRAQLGRDFAGDPRLPYWDLTVRYGILGAQAHQAWCDEAVARLIADRRAARAASRPRRRGAAKRRSPRG